MHKPVYIPSVEASDVYSHMYRDMKIKLKHIGMIPSSLELNKLIEIGLNTRHLKTGSKIISNDVINIKFRQKALNAKGTLENLNRKLEGLKENNSSSEKNKNKKIEYEQKLIDYIEIIQKNKDLDIWNEINNDDLRILLYTQGFIIDGQKYVAYKRSSAKSRVGQCLFIKKQFYEDMISWSRMYLPMNNAKINFPSLLAYESLVGSSLEDVIHIDPKNILIVNDIESRFMQDCNVIRTGENGFLESFQEETMIKNSLFDGESLLDSSYFTDNKSMKLLRNHNFKSAAFNCEIQNYLRDRCPENIPYEKWELSNMFGHQMYAKDVHLIITPSSLKALKFSSVFGSGITAETEMYNYWKKIIYDEGCWFGVCKSEKQSKHGIDDDGNMLQQLSYQMINSLPISRGDIEELTQYELGYVKKLKNDDDFFIEHIKKSMNSINCNEMFVDLFNQNKDIVHIKLFRDFRRKEINKHVEHIKKGKVRLNGDYCTMLGNPMEFLSHAIGIFNEDESTLKGNEVYTTLFEFNKEYAGFRNPHTSPSNILVVKNIHNEHIEKYFNLSPNIICVNSIRFPLPDILSGSDFDSDTLLLCADKKIIELSKKCFGKYKVAINCIGKSEREYEINQLNMAVIDNRLSKSQKNIGTVVNLGQELMSVYWDKVTIGDSKPTELNDLLNKIDVMNVLSGVSIDLAKREYEIEIDDEIRNMRKSKELRKKKPLFFKFIKSNDIQTTMYNCPMDYLYQTMSGIKYANHRKNTPFNKLLTDCNIKKADRKQQKKIIDYIEDMCDKIRSVYADRHDQKDKEKIVDSIITHYEFFIQKLKVSPNSMHALLLKVSEPQYSKILLKMMVILHRTQKDTFLNAFKKVNYIY